MRRAAAVAMSLAFGMLVGEAGPVGGQETFSGSGTCRQPYQPVYVERHGVSGNAPQDPPPATQLSSVDVRRSVPGDDFNDDGTSDVTYNGDHTEATVQHPSGAFVFTFNGEHVLAHNLGDVDGDGSPDIEVTTAPIGADSLSGLYIVPSSTAPGSYEPGDVGIRLDPGSAGALDLVGDGDLEITVFAGDTTDVYSAADVFAVGAPGDARDVEPVATYEGGLGLVDFGDGRGDLIIGQRTDFSIPEMISLYQRGVTKPFATFTTGENHTGPLVRASVGDGGRYLTLENSQRNQISETFSWSIDDPCTPLRAAAITETPSAVPVVANPNFTG